MNLGRANSGAHGLVIKPIHVVRINEYNLSEHVCYYQQESLLLLSQTGHQKLAEQFICAQRVICACENCTYSTLIWHTIYIHHPGA